MNDMRVPAPWSYELHARDAGLVHTDLGHRVERRAISSRSTISTNS
jgi:hypothetical protein